MFYLEQLDGDERIVTSINFETQEEADTAHYVLDFLLESVEVPSGYYYKITERKECALQG